MPIEEDLATLQFPRGIDEIFARVEEIYDRYRTEKDLEDRRARRGCWKRLSDEIKPAMPYLALPRYAGMTARFPQDSGPFDLEIFNEAGNITTLERVDVTIAGAEFQIARALYMNDHGHNVCNIPPFWIRNVASFQKYMENLPNRRSYGTDSAIAYALSELEAALDRKRQKKMTVLVEFDAGLLPEDVYRRAIKENLQNPKDIKFAIVGNHHGSRWLYEPEG